MEHNFSKRQEKIIRLLLERDEYINANTIAEMLKVSDKTVRNDIVDINAELEIPVIITRKGKGFFIDEKGRCSKYILGRGNREGRRELLILKEILSSKDVDYYSIADKFYISNSTLDKDIHLLNNMIRSHFNDLQIIRKNNRLLIECDDNKKRKILTYFLLEEIDNNNFNINNFSSYFENINIEKLKDIIIKYLQDEGIEILDYSLISLLLHITIILDRVVNGSVDVYDYAEDEDGYSLKCKPLCLEISKLINQPLPDNEIKNIESFFETRFHLKNSEKYEAYLVFLEIVLNEVSENYNIDFIGYDELKNNLAVHLKELASRVKNMQLLRNPLLKEIKNKFTLVYDISVYIAIKFQEIMNYVISEDEIGYIALHILRALEKFKSKKVKIVIINPYSPSISKLIEGRLSDHLDSDIEVVGNYSVFDYKKIYRVSPDLILTLVSIHNDFGVPIYKINSFFYEEDFIKVYDFINRIKLQRIMENFTISNYFSQNLFFNHLSLDTKEDVLKFMCDKLKELNYIDDNFIEYVKLREEIAPTAFGSEYAIPHPAKKIAHKNGIAVAILQHPIQWGNCEVKIVLLFSLHSSFDQIPKLYDILLNILDNSDSFKKIISVENFSEFIDIINNEIRLK